MKKILLILFVLLIIAAFAFRKIFLQAQYVAIPTLSAQIQSQELIVDGHTRTFLWYAPVKNGSPTSLLFVLHGSTGDGPGVRKQTAYQFEQLADEKGFVVVYPTGYANHWNDCRGSADYEANIENINDLHFLKAVEKDLAERLNTNFTYRFSTGHSNGGHYSFKLALEAPDWIDGIAAISANLPIDSNLDCQKSGQFVPMLLINGTADKVNPYEGGLVSILGNDSRGTVLSTDETMNYWAHIGHCQATSKEVKLADIQADDQSYITQSDWQCEEQTLLRLLKVVNGGHTIPSTKQSMARILGATNRDLDAPIVIWDFFEQIIVSRGEKLE